MRGLLDLMNNNWTEAISLDLKLSGVMLQPVVDPNTCKTIVTCLMCSSKQTIIVVPLSSIYKKQTFDDLSTVTISD